METEVVVALVSSLTSVAVAVGTAVWTAKENGKSRKVQLDLSEAQHASGEELEKLKYRLQQQTQEEERRAQETVQLARFREPLLDAAEELRHRLRNIREDGFLIYLQGPRRDHAIFTTFFRLARYFGVLEMLYAQVNYLKFQTATETKAVAELLANIGRTFASDEYDRTNGFETSRFMIWREEQRAMGEAAIDQADDQRNDLVGYAAFVQRLEGGASKWFASFKEDLEHADAVPSTRFERLHVLLSQLVGRLDIEDRLAR
jgi:hypothetical protein